MRPFYHSDERRASLLNEALKWVGTPWRPDSAEKGHGVACHNLPRVIYMANAALPGDFPEIHATPNVVKHSVVSAMEAFIDKRPEFTPVERDNYVPMAGDLLGLRITRCLDHLGVVLDDRSFIHVLMRRNTRIDMVKITPWAERTLRVWRIME